MEENWTIFNEASHYNIERNIPTKIIKNYKNLSWLHQVQDQKKKLLIHYIQAKRIVTQCGSDWTAYRQLRNEINNLMSKTHEKYCIHLFDE